jgi:hypothetical protein
LREIGGFDKCTSLCRIEILSSVEIITESGFTGCTSLNEIIFSIDSHLREIGGFHFCTSLCRIDIPSSVEIISQYGFFRCKSLSKVTFAVDSRVQIIKGFNKCTTFLVHQDHDFMKQNRRRLHVAAHGCPVRT